MGLPRRATAWASCSASSARGESARGRRTRLRRRRRPSASRTTSPCSRSRLPPPRCSPPAPSSRPESGARIAMRRNARVSPLRKRAARGPSLNGSPGLHSGNGADRRHLPASGCPLPAKSTIASGRQSCRLQRAACDFRPAPPPAAGFGLQYRQSSNLGERTWMEYTLFRGR
jgi:hypothetical protein